MKKEWHFSAASEDLKTMEEAEKLFLARGPYRGATVAEYFETKLERRNGLWQLLYREVA